MRKMTVAIAAGAVALLAGAAVQGYPAFELGRDAKRLTEIRRGGVSEPGPWMAYINVRISKRDLDLLDCDLSYALRNNPDVRREVIDGFIYQPARDLERITDSELYARSIYSFGRMRERGDTDWKLTHFTVMVPRSEYLAPAEDVVRFCKERKKNIEAVH